MGCRPLSGVAAAWSGLVPRALAGVAGREVADGRRAEPTRSLERSALSGGQVGRGAKARTCNAERLREWQRLR